MVSCPHSGQNSTPTAVASTQAMSPGLSFCFLASLAGVFCSVHSGHPEEGVLASGGMGRVHCTAFLDPTTHGP